MIRHLHEQRGYTLVELLVAMATGIIVTLAAFAILEFATKNIFRTTERVHVDQGARVVKENIMERLHSGCVALKFAPVLEDSTATKLVFVSESGAEVSFSENGVHKYEIVYNAPEHTLTDRSYPSIPEEKGGGKAPDWTFLTTPSATQILTSVSEREEENPETHNKEKVPIFQYYRYWQEGESSTYHWSPGETGDGNSAGEIHPVPLLSTTHTELSATDAASVAKVAISFTTAPYHANQLADQHAPVELTDAAIFRDSPSSSSEHTINPPCE